MFVSSCHIARLSNAPEWIRDLVDQSANQTRQLRPYRPPLGIPEGRENARLGIVVSVALHVLLALLLIVPLTSNVVMPILQGAGGRGPAGGGGGGRGGTGGSRPPAANERLQYMQVAPQPAPVAPQPVPKSPVIVPAKPVETPRPPAPTIKADSSSATKPQPSSDVAAASGSGGGSGTDGTNGSGPGSGGGTGTGVGTGRGSGVRAQAAERRRTIRRSPSRCFCHRCRFLIACAACA
jgi:periplasmic protein TonB